MQLTGFNGKIALVTGAAGGIGAAVVRLLRASGATVVATDRDAPAVPGSPEHIDGIHSHALDVTDAVAVDTRAVAGKSAGRARGIGAAAFL